MSGRDDRGGVDDHFDDLDEWLDDRTQLRGVGTVLDAHSHRHEHLGDAGDGEDRREWEHGVAAPSGSTRPDDPPPPAAARGRRDLRRTAIEYGGLAAVALVLAALIRTFLGLAFYIPSGSMVPTLKINDRVVVSRLSYRLHEPHRGDVVVFDNPSREFPQRALPYRVVQPLLEVIGFHQDKDRNLIKRVIGLPGETIEVRTDATVWIDGKQLQEPWLPERFTSYDSPQAPLKIPAGHYFMMGDSRNNSSDSRVFGPVDRKKFVGRAFVKIWPIWRARWL